MKIIRIHDIRVLEPLMRELGVRVLHLVRDPRSCLMSRAKLEKSELDMASQRGNVTSQRGNVTSLREVLSQKRTGLGCDQLLAELMESVPRVSPACFTLHPSRITSLHSVHVELKGLHSREQEHLSFQTRAEASCQDSDVFLSISWTGGRGARSLVIDICLVSIWGGVLPLFSSEFLFAG